MVPSEASEPETTKETTPPFAKRKTGHAFACPVLSLYESAGGLEAQGRYPPQVLNQIGGI